MSIELTKFDFSTGINAETIKRFLVHCYRCDVSDIHLQSGSPIVVNLHGRFIQCTPFPIEHSSLLGLVDVLFSTQIKAQVQKGQGADRALQLEGNEKGLYGLLRGERIRFRVNFVQATIRGLSTAMAITLRVINNHIPSLDSLNLDERLYQRLSILPHEGFGLVVGPTGSGKSTTLSSIYQHHGTTNSNCKVVTYEDPVETLLGGKAWLLQPQQSEIRHDVESFSEGLRLSLRQAPTVIGIGEIRDFETVQGALANALSGHFCQSTLHAFSPGHAFSRCMLMAPIEIREQIAHDLLELTQFIVMQRLVPTTDGKRQAVREYVIFDEALRHHLKALPYTKWPDAINAQLTVRGERIADLLKVWLSEGKISRDSALSMGVAA